MKISLEDISKRFQRHWIFKQLSATYTAPGKYAILGPNGSGKSTLLRIVAGMQAASKGTVSYEHNGQSIPTNKIYIHVSYCAPGQEIVEELTFREFLEFHFSFKQPLQGLSIQDIINQTGLQNMADKPVGDYSSGMRQRVKLAQAFFSRGEILLLDEPCTNLDEQGVAQYKDWIDRYTDGRLVIVASNDVREYFFCTERLEMADYK